MIKIVYSVRNHQHFPVVYFPSLSLVTVPSAKNEEEWVKPWVSLSLQGAGDMTLWLYFLVYTSSSLFTINGANKI